MKQVWIACCALMLVAGGAQAQEEPLPDSVARPYLAYETAMTAGDYTAAREAAERAWRAALTARLDAELTGILAENYGQLATAHGEYGAAYEAWRDAAEISDRSAAPAAERAMRWYQASLAAFANGDSADARQCSMRASEAEESAETPLDSQLSGDLNYMVATTSAQAGRVRAMGRHARLAIAAFEAGGRPYDRLYGNAYYLAGIGSFFVEGFHEGALDLHAARRIMEDLDDPDRAGDIRRADMWRALAVARLSEAETELLEEAIAASAFPRNEESPSPIDDDPGYQDAERIELVEPTYPSPALGRGQEGVVMVQFSIGEDGRTHEIEVVDAFPTGVFDQACIRAVEDWRYEPALRDGIPVRRADWVTMFTFLLESGSDPATPTPRPRGSGRIRNSD